MTLWGKKHYYFFYRWENSGLSPNGGIYTLSLEKSEDWVFWVLEGSSKAEPYTAPGRAGAYPGAFGQNSLGCPILACCIGPVPYLIVWPVCQGHTGNLEAGWCVSVK